MSKTVPVMLVLPAAFAAALVAASSPAAPALHATLQIKPGLWEFDDTAKVSGDTVFPDAVLAGVPASQRAQRLAQLRQMIAQPSRERECISQRVFEQRLFGIETACKRTIVANSSRRFELVSECHGQSGGVSQSKTARILAASPNAVTTSFHAVGTEDGKTMTVDSIEHGRWISASCGNVHGIQQLR